MKSITEAVRLSVDELHFVVKAFGDAVVAGEAPHGDDFLGPGLFFVDDGAAGEEVAIRQDDGPYGYQLAAMLCFLIFADNLLRRIEGPGDSVWFWLSSSRWELIFVSGVLSVVCQLLFWSGTVRRGNNRIRRE